ncbi:MAG: M50 family metallopeptidase [Candidatus Micrarchaeaceae archaeon]
MQSTQRLAHIKKYSLPLSIAAAFLAVLFVYAMYLSSAGILARWAASLLVLLLCGEIIMLLNGFKGIYGIYMIGSRRGIAFIDNLSKNHKAFWSALADWGLVVSLGFFAYPLLRKGQHPKRMLIFGIATLLALLLLVMPNLSYSMQFINLPQISSRIASEAVASAQATGLNYLSYAIYIVTLIGGFATFTLLVILENAASILYGIAIFLASVAASHPNPGALSSQIPGVAPVIPGITIPLFAGIISLFILLFLHEFSHGILARQAKVKLKSIGIAIFGIIPVGAFVEPDEKEIRKLPKMKQIRILIAGVSSNLLASIAFFALMMLFVVYVLPGIMTYHVIVEGTLPGYPANGIIAPGSTILEWNGYAIKNITSFTVAAKNDKPYSSISVLTDKGSYRFTTNETGKIGVYVEQVSTPKAGILSGSANFLYMVFALSFLLNFLVAVVNLLPIPGFDGWRIYQLNISKRALNVLAIIIVLALLANVLPWLWLK